jgi:hypothetical protein
MTITRGKANKKSNLRNTKATLPKGMKFAKNAKKRIVVKVNGKKVKTFTAKGRVLRIKSKSTTKKITVSTKKRAVKESRKVRRGGKKKKLTFKFAIKVQGGKTYKITKKVKPRS